MIAAATEDWAALYIYSEQQTDVVIERQIAAWVYYPGVANDHEAMLFAGMVVDDTGNIKPAHLVDRFICYKAPGENPAEIIKRRAASKNV